MGATWGRRPHNFLAVGAIAPIAPMESAPMAAISKSKFAERGWNWKPRVAHRSRIVRHTAVAHNAAQFCQLQLAIKTQEADNVR